MTETIAKAKAEEWQLREIRAALVELDAGRVAEWLNSWGKPGETKAPR
jgi:predicted transcriptional regulator